MIKENRTLPDLLWRCIRRILTAGTLLALTSGVSAGERVIFTQTSFEDFAAGTPGNSGQNLFVSRDGALRFINWFDLNRDSYPDLVVNNDHRSYENVDAMIYHNRGGRGLQSLSHPIADEIPPFQRLQWEQQSLKDITFLPTLGGGTTLIVDLNGDGFLDIIFTNLIHGWAKDRFPIFIYWGAPSGYSVANRSELPSMWARGLAAADLSGDGRLDLVVANYGMEYHASETFFGDQYETWVYWQDDRGFSQENRLSLPTEYAIDAQVADLDRNGRQEIVILNTGPRPAVRIFSSDGDKFAGATSVDLPVLNPAFVKGPKNELLVADLNDDGWLDLFVTSAGDASEVFWNGPDGFTAARRTELPTLNATAAAARDLNGDGRTDLVIANFFRHTDAEDDYEAPSYIYWGGDEPFSPDRRTELPTLGAAGIAIGDVTGDGVDDIVFANNRDNRAYDVPTYIYAGAASGYSAKRRSELGAFGPVDVTLADLSGSGRLDVVITNRYSGRVVGAGHELPSFVYWGNETGTLSTAAMTRLPVCSGYSSNAGDLNHDGHADLVFADHDAITVLHGCNGDFPADRMSVIPMPFRGMTTSLADFNRDGWLDVLVGALRDNDSLAILYGREGGFSEPVYFDVGMSVVASAVADLNGDGRLQIILGGRGDICILPLTEAGRPDCRRIEWLRMGRQSQRLTLADLDGNGYLELIAAHYRNNVTKRLTVSSAIYWNRDGRLDAEDRTDLQTYGGHWASVADAFGSGKLDLLFSNYHGEHRRDVDLFIYSPDSEGRYGTSKRTVPAASSSAHLVMDFTGDGRPDLFVANHTGPNQYVGLSSKSGVHAYGSYFYEGSAVGFTPGRRVILPSLGPHKLINADPGDIFRRRPFETYTSAWVAVQPVGGECSIVIDGRFNARAGVDVFLRTDERGDWTAAEPAPSDAARQQFTVALNDPATRVQYQLRLHSGGSGTGPIVESVQMIKQ